MKKILIALMMMGLSTGAMAEEVSNADLLKEIKQLKKEVAELKDNNTEQEQYELENCDTECHNSRMEAMHQIEKITAENWKRLENRRLCNKQSMIYIHGSVENCYKKYGIL